MKVTAVLNCEFPPSLFGFKRQIDNLKNISVIICFFVFFVCCCFVAFILTCSFTVLVLSVSDINKKLLRINRATGSCYIALIYLDRQQCLLFRNVDAAILNLTKNFAQGTEYFKVSLASLWTLKDTVCLHMKSVCPSCNIWTDEICSFMTFEI